MIGLYVNVTTLCNSMNLEYLHILKEDLEFSLDTISHASFYFNLFFSHVGSVEVVRKRIR